MNLSVRQSGFTVYRRYKPDKQQEELLKVRHENLAFSQFAWSEAPQKILSDLKVHSAVFTCWEYLWACNQISSVCSLALTVQFEGIHAVVVLRFMVFRYLIFRSVWLFPQHVFAVSDDWNLAFYENDMLSKPIKFWSVFLIESLGINLFVIDYSSENSSSTHEPFLRDITGKQWLVQIWNYSRTPHNRHLTKSSYSIMWTLRPNFLVYIIISKQRLPHNADTLYQVPQVSV